MLSLWRASSVAMLKMRELVPFTEAKCSFALVVLAHGPADTWWNQELLLQGQGTAESYEWCPLLWKQLFCQAQNYLPTSHTRCFITWEKSGEKNPTHTPPKPLTHLILLPLQPFHSSSPWGCASQAERLCFKQHVDRNISSHSKDISAPCWLVNKYTV